MASSRILSAVVIAALVAVGVSSVAVTAVGLQRDPLSDPAPVTATEDDPSRPVGGGVRTEAEAAAVLAGWDAERSSAWAAGDVRRLRALYTPGSVAGERDVAMLRRWLDRGLTVQGLRTQVLDLREVSRAPDRWVLAVVDRVVGGSVGGTRLPADRPSPRQVVLRWTGGRWLVASVGVSPPR